MNSVYINKVNRLTRILLSRILRFIHRPFIDFNNNLNLINSEIVKRFGRLDRAQLANAIVFDLGANRGDFSKWALDRGATVIAFEPDKDVYIQLVKRLNKFKNFFPFNSAVSNKTGLSEFYYHKSKKIDPIGFSVSSSLLAEKPNIDNLFSNTVFCIDLGTLIKELPIKLIKIDIEGAENLIWPAIKQNYRNLEYLLLEIHNTNSKELITEIKIFIEENNLENKWRTDWI